LDRKIKREATGRRASYRTKIGLYIEGGKELRGRRRTIFQELRGLRLKRRNGGGV